MGAYKARLVAFCVVAICTFENVFAQFHESVELTGGVGWVVNNHPDFPDSSGMGYNFCLNYSRHFDGFKPWHRYYNYPKFGVSLNGGSCGNPSVLGNYLGLMANMSFEKKINENWFWAPRLSLGSAYFTDPYDEQKNPENVVIGSHTTFLAGAELLFGLKINPQTDIVTKVGILHASNSHFKLPNVGMNMPLFSVGVRYRWEQGVSPEKKQAAHDSVSLTTSNKIRFHTRFALGVNEVGSSTIPVNGPKSPIYLASVYVSKMYSPVNKVTIGLEGWYNQGVYDFIVSQEFYEDDQKLHSCAAAIVLGHEFLMGHFGLLTTAGIYIYNPFYKERLERNEIDGFKDKLKSYIPARLGVQYYLKNTNFQDRNNLFVGLYIKTNFGQADFLESGVGYMF